MSQKDIWWIEYLEGEMDPSLKADLELLLRRSKKDRKSLRELARFRSWVKSADIADSLWKDRQFKKLQSSIMEKIEKLGPEKKANPKGKRTKSYTKPRGKLWRSQTNGVVV